MSYKPLAFCLKSSLLLLLLLFFQRSVGQYDLKEFDQFIQQNRLVLGRDLVVMVYKGDSLVYKKEQGDFTSNTQAPVASCS